MSFLLDALRKSERSGRQRAAPTIHSMEPSASERYERSEWLPLALLGGAAFVLMAWFGLQQFEIFQGGPGAAEPAAQQTAAVTPGASEPERASAAPAVSEPAADTRAANPPVARAVANAPRTPVEQLEVSPQSGGAAAGSGNASGAAARTGPGAGSAPATIPKDPAMAVAQPTVAPRQNHIDYWELPGNVRGQLPELKIKVLVYAELPDNRFILVNGSRLGEGEELQPGLRVEEIRRDGVIFSYQRYRFLVSS